VDNERRLTIIGNLKRQCEDLVEAAIMNTRICVKVKDDKGAEAGKKNIAELEARLAECVEIEKELTKKEPEKPKE